MPKVLVNTLKIFKHFFPNQEFSRICTLIDFFFSLTSVEASVSTSASCPASVIGTAASASAAGTPGFELEMEPRLQIILLIFFRQFKFPFFKNINQTFSVNFNNV